MGFPESETGLHRSNLALPDMKPAWNNCYKAYHHINMLLKMSELGCRDMAFSFIGFDIDSLKSIFELRIDKPSLAA